MEIQILGSELASKIAAGEVVSRPASVTKELVENALDAGANQIEIEITNGGMDLIRVTDNGHGIPSNEMSLAFQHHATSKIHSGKDLNNIATLGFRGEALPSIAAVSHVNMKSLAQGHHSGHEITIQHANLLEQKPCGCSPGTIVAVQNLFHNFPARRKFLKSPSYETSKIADLITRLAISSPAVKFRLIVEDRKTINTPGNGNLTDTITSIYGLEVSRNLLEVNYFSPTGYVINGCITIPEYTRSNRKYITLIVNKRWIQNRSLIFALEQAYHGLLTQGRHPIAILNLKVPFEEMDVNIHPSKREVRFQDDNSVFALVQKSVRSTLMESAPIPQISSEYKHQNASVPYKNIAVRGVGLASSRKFQGDTTSTQQLHLSHKQKLPSLKALGQINHVFIACAAFDGLYLIDQHAAHERILFEKAGRNIATKESVSQPLLEPLIVNLSPEQETHVQRNANALKKYGYVIEPFGEKTYLIRSIPAIMAISNPIDSLLELIDLDAQDRVITSSEERIAASIACHSAIRAGMKLEQDHMQNLIDQLSESENPRICAHGRPTVVHLSSRYLEREFGR